jgi:hypothetical protein
VKTVQILLQMHSPCREDVDHERCEGAVSIEREGEPTAVAVCTCACHWVEFDAALVARQRPAWNGSRS